MQNVYPGFINALFVPLHIEGNASLPLTHTLTHIKSLEQTVQRPRNTATNPSKRWELQCMSSAAWLHMP
jgi:hypothetical protein